jgi:uncharacterized protein with GYD domain
MPKYLFRSRHTPEGVKGLIKDGGTSRRAESERFVASVGGKIECFYYAFGASDVSSSPTCPTTRQLPQ